MLELISLLPSGNGSKHPESWEIIHESHGYYWSKSSLLRLDFLQCLGRPPREPRVHVWDLLMQTNPASPTRNSDISIDTSSRTPTIQKYKTNKEAIYVSTHSLFGTDARYQFYRHPRHYCHHANEKRDFLVGHCFGLTPPTSDIYNRK